MKKIAMVALPIASVVATPIIITSCSSVERTNFVTTYDNAFDDAVTLGIKPDYNSSGNWTDYVSKYVKELMAKTGTQQLDFRFFPKGGGSLDPKKIASTKADVVVANITDSGFTNQIKNVVNNIAFTGRGDDKSWSYSDEQINFVDLASKFIKDDTGSAVKDSSQTTLGEYVDVGITGNDWQTIASGATPINNKFFETDYGYSSKLYELQQNPFIALQKLAKSLDDLSGNKNKFVDRANQVEQMQKERLIALNSNSIVQSKINNKTIGFILGKKKDSNSTDVVDNIQLYNPHTFPQFYSRKNDRGLKMLFPAFDNYSTNFNSSHFGDPDIIAGNDKSFNTFMNSSDGNTVLSMFSHKFDYIVYMAYDGGSFAHSAETVINSELKNFLKTTATNQTGQQTTTQATNDDIKKHIFYTTYSDMYMGTWGPIGQSLTITNFIKWINSIQDTNSAETGESKATEITEDKNLILHETIDTNSLKSWRDLK